ncbi:MAG TPA: UDP-glucose 4-epimerase GalE [Limnochordales bacterium]
MKVLVTGGAGYVGSHTVLGLVEAGHQVTVLDDLSTGRRELVHGARLVLGDIGDPAALEAALESQGPFDAAMHFAARTQVGESMADPGRYFATNVAGTLQLLRALVARGVRWFVFSSSAAVYGEPRQTPIPEEHPLAPTNPYGESKRMVEAMLGWFERAHGLRWVSLRYFNAAGADPRGRTGECHEPETHLIPSVLLAALGRREAVEIYGDDWPTPDGTCIRDFVHVCDLAEAHRLALEYLARGGASAAFNLGSGRGWSVRQVVETCRRVTGRSFPVRIGPRRPGDPAVLVASNERARAQLGWRPRYDSLEVMVETAWAWHRKGY